VIRARQRPISPGRKGAIDVAATSGRADAAGVLGQPLDAMLIVQSTLGNQGVFQRMEAGLRINDVNDPAEREADRVASAVMSGGERRAPGTTGIRERVSQTGNQKSAHCQKEEMQIHRKEAAGSQHAAPLPIVKQILGSSGHVLDRGTRDFMEQRFGNDFGHVRIHSDDNASRISRQIGARAFTVGPNIFLDRPSRLSDHRLIAHELTHVIQQNWARFHNQPEPVSQAMLVQREPGDGGVLAGEPGKRPNLDVGSVGPAVVLLQTLLGIDTTGVFEDPTRRAVIAFQAARPELHPATGGVGPKTWLALDSIVQKKAISPGAPGNRPNLDVGDMGPAVSLLQGLLGIQPTGNFDEATRQAVVEFQEERTELYPATGGVGPKTWQALDAGSLTGQLKVGDTVLGEGTLSLADAGGVVTGGHIKASGMLTLGGSVLAGGLAVVAQEGGTVAKAARTVKAVTDVASRNAEAIRLARQMQIVLAKGLRPPVSAVPPAATFGLWAARGGVVTVGLAAGIAIALSPLAVAYASEVYSRFGEFGKNLPPGGLPPPMKDPNNAEEISEPGGDAGAPLQAPGTTNGETVDAPGAASDPVVAPGVSSAPVELGGLRIPLSKRRARRLPIAENAKKWTDIRGEDRTGLGKDYNSIIEILVREIASGGLATVLHYPKVTKAMLKELAKQGGRLIITEGRLPSGGRFDIVDINFDKKTVVIIDITALMEPKHGSKTGGYATEIGDLTGFPVKSYEGRYVIPEGGLSDEIIFVELGKK